MPHRPAAVTRRGRRRLDRRATGRRRRTHGPGARRRPPPGAGARRDARGHGRDRDRGSALVEQYEP